MPFGLGRGSSSSSDSGKKATFRIPGYVLPRNPTAYKIEGILENRSEVVRADIFEEDGEFGKESYVSITYTGSGHSNSEWRKIVKDAYDSAK